MSTRRNDRIADSVHLLAAVAAVAVSPDALTALRSGPAAYDAVRKLAAAPPSGVGRLAEVLGAEARALFEATRDLPPDAEVLYAQMVEAGLVTPGEVVAGGMDAAAVTEAMLGKLSEPEHRSAAMQGLFRRLTVPVLARLLASRDFAADLTPAFMHGVLGQLAGLGEKLDRLDRVTRLEMEALANRFEIERIFALSDAELRNALEKRASDYRAYKARIEAIDARTAGLGNLKAAAKDAAERLDFDEVERLLARVDEVETGIAAETKEVRADNALLRGRVGDAFAILSAAADSFASVSSTEPALRRQEFARRLYVHGLRYGSSGLALAVQMLRRALEDLSETATPNLWAGAQNNLGNALRRLGYRTGGPVGAAMLGESIYVSRLALKVLGEDTKPEQWAGAQNNIGVTLDMLSRRTEGAPGEALLIEAVTAYHSALRARTKAEYPEEWAETQHNLGNALLELGRRLRSAEGLGPIRNAVSAFRAVLRVRSEDNDPLGWAMTQDALGSALEAEGRRTDGEAGTMLLEEAVGARRSALRVRTEAEHPVDWATTTNNLGAAFEGLARRTAGVARVELLGEAITNYRAALRVRIEDAHPMDWGMTMVNLGLAHEALAEETTYPEPRLALEEAAQSLVATLRVYDPEHTPNDYRKATVALARVRAKLGDA